jgi:hypothetical protein
VGSDGRIEVVMQAGALGRLRPPVLLLGRDLCSYALFDPGPLPRGQRRRAALIYAQTNGPYLETGSLVLPTGKGLGVWWWDLARVREPMLARYGRQRPVVRPESLAIHRGMGWRILSLAKGFEAQLWDDDELKVSTWRKARFDARAWSDITRLHSQGEPAPETPPTPLMMPYSIEGQAFGLTSIELTREQALFLVAGLVATVAATASLYLVGTTYGLDKETREVARETVQIVASTPKVGALGTGRAEDARLAAFQAVARETSPLTSAGAAISAAAIYDLSPTALAAESDTVSMTLPPAAAERIDELVAELEGSGYFEAIRPRIEPTTRNLIIEMAVIDE